MKKSKIDAWKMVISYWNSPLLRDILVLQEGITQPSCNHRSTMVTRSRQDNARRLKVPSASLKVLDFACLW